MNDIDTIRAALNEAPREYDVWMTFDPTAALASLDRVEAALIECDRVFRGPLTHVTAVPARDLLAPILEKS